jgi:hypothetical protein
MHFLRFTVSLVVLASLSACVADLPYATDVESQLRASLATGSSRTAIEAALGKQGVSFSYDEHASRYQGIIRSKSSDLRAVVVYVTLDSSGKMTGLSAVDSYTGP